MFKMLTGKDTQWLKGYLPTNVNTNNTSGKKRVTKNSYGNKTKQKSKIHSIKERLSQFQSQIQD